MSVIISLMTVISQKKKENIKKGRKKNTIRAMAEFDSKFPEFLITATVKMKYQIMTCL